MTLKAFGAVDWGQIDGRPVEAIIAEAWDKIAELLEAGTISDNQHLVLLDREAAFGDTPIARYLVARMLRRALAGPSWIGTNLPEATPPGTCVRCRGDHVVDEATGMAPCPACQPRGRLLWATGHFAPDHRGCSECRPAARQRGPGANHDDEAEDRARRIVESLT